MRSALLLVAAIALAAPAGAQQTASPTAPAMVQAAGSTAAAADPVSLDRIREGLRRAENQRLLRGLDLKADFTMRIEEQDRIDRLMSKIEVPKAGPVPGGGWYGYEQQRQLFNPVDRPLQQPYAAYNGGQLITVALENLIGRYAGKKIVNAVQTSAQSRAEMQARQEVEQSIADYCASRSDRDFIQLCTSRER
jgi:hypothetical protein